MFTVTTWDRVIMLLWELAQHDFAVFGPTDEAADIVDRMIEIAQGQVA